MTPDGTGSPRGVDSAENEPIESEAPPQAVNIDGTWFSPDHLWQWDGCAWIAAATGGKRAGMAFELWVARGIVFGQVGITALSGLMAIGLGGLTTIVGGAQWLALGLGVSTGGIALIGLAAFLSWMQTRLRPRWDVWKAGALVFELGLIPVGVWLLSFPQSTTTHGPFADGGEGAIGLMGSAYAAGGGVVLLVILHQARQFLLKVLERFRPFAAS